MFPHPEYLLRLQQQQHAELIRARARERLARAAHPPTHRLRLAALHVRGLLPSRLSRKGITLHFNRHRDQVGTVATALRDGGLPTITPPSSAGIRRKAA